MSWTASKITADAASKFQVDAGLLVKNFKVATPKEPADEDIIGETTGSYNIACKAVMGNRFEGVNGLRGNPNLKEGAYLKYWDCSLGVSLLSITKETLELSLGTTTTGENSAIVPGEDVLPEDFESVCWIADMGDPTKLLCVEMSDVLSAEGLNFTSNDDGKGNLNITLKPYATSKDPRKCPMQFYILTKQDGETMSASAKEVKK